MFVGVFGGGIELVVGVAVVTEIKVVETVEGAGGVVKSNDDSACVLELEVDGGEDVSLEKVMSEGSCVGPGVKEMTSVDVSVMMSCDVEDVAKGVMVMISVEVLGGGGGATVTMIVEVL